MGRRHLRRYKAPECSYAVNGDGSITTDGTVKRKMTGTTLGGILGCSPWSTPFQVACSLLGLAREDIGSKPAVKTGVVLESRVIAYAGLRFAAIGKFDPAEEVFAKREGDHDTWASDFDDEYFGGHVDGIVFTPEGSRVLEVKTTGTWDKWGVNDAPGRNGVPEWYYWQVALYDHFVIGAGSAYMLVAKADPSTHSHPDDWSPSDDNVLLLNPLFDEAEVTATLDIAREWYDTYIANGVTPPYDPTNPGDVEMYEHLVNLTSPEELIKELVARDLELREILDTHKEEVKAVEAEKKELDARIKDYIVNSGSESLSVNGYVAKVSTRRDTYVDVDAFAADHPEIDLTPYRREKVTNTFTLKPKKIKEE